MCLSNCACRLFWAAWVLIRASKGTINCRPQQVHSAISGVGLSHFSVLRVRVIGVLLYTTRFRCGSCGVMFSKKQPSSFIVRELGCEFACKPRLNSLSANSQNQQKSRLGAAKKTRGCQEKGTFHTNQPNPVVALSTQQRSNPESEIELM